MTLEEAFQKAGYELSAALALAKAAQGSPLEDALYGAVAVLNAQAQRVNTDSPLGQAFQKLVVLICQGEGG